MIVELIVNQIFTKPFKMKGNLKNVFFETTRKSCVADTVIVLSWVYNPENGVQADKVVKLSTVPTIEYKPTK